MIIEVKAFATRFESAAKVEEFAAKLTDAACEVFGEEVRAETWIVFEPTEKSLWAFGGKIRK
jgi:phenylpyruvate tautomerase PptA (4-oxalocrotonate tautomerase family)